MKSILVAAILFLSCCAYAQSYEDSLNAFIKNYVATHEVVKGNDTKYLQFFPIDKSYCIVATFERKNDAQWFQMKTSGLAPKTFRLYGIAKFLIHDTLLQLSIYQSQALMQKEGFKNYLFIPFTDATTGNETYASGRYIDLTFDDIKNNSVIIDFNKAYNPNCAYVTGKYNCPIPPAENSLPVAIKAGEKNYGKSH